MSRAEALAARAMAAHKQGNLGEAEKSYRAFLSLEPNHPVALHLLGALLHARGKSDAAVPFLERAAKLNPGDAEIYNNLGVALNELGRREAAVAHFALALAITPRSAKVHSNLGVAFRGLRRLGEAQDSLERALELGGGSPEVYGNLGHVLLDLGDAHAAVAAFGEATKLRPGRAQDHVHLGNAYLTLGDHARARDCFLEAARLDPGHGTARAMSRLARQYLCDWTDWDAEIALFSAAKPAWRLDEDRPSPFVTLPLTDDPKVQLNWARSYAQKFRNPVVKTKPRKAGGNSRIRLAYVSPDIRQHPVATLMSDLLLSHDALQFDVTVISYGPDDGSAVRQRIQAGVERFVDVQAKSDVEIDALIRDLEIDIAIDLAGFTTLSRPGILNARPARVQAAYLGFPGTSGADWIDYTIGDAFIAPAALEDHFSEAFARMPNCFQANGARPELPATAPTKVGQGLPPDGFVFCCFSANYKFVPAVFDVWMRLLASVPGSILWLVADGEVARDNLRQEASRRLAGGGKRLVFARRVAFPEHLARHALADLFLDTLPFNGGTTASDALWMGLPVITCAGRSYNSRMAGSLLTAMGVPELVTHDLAAYEKRALELACNPDELAALRGTLMDNRARQALFDAKATAGHLENAYRTMLTRAERNLRPVSFSVEAG